MFAARLPTANKTAVISLTATIPNVARHFRRSVRLAPDPASAVQPFACQRAFPTHPHLRPAAQDGAQTDHPSAAGDRVRIEHLSQFAGLPFRTPAGDAEVGGGPSDAAMPEPRRFASRRCGCAACCGCGCCCGSARRQNRAALVVAQFAAGGMPLLAWCSEGIFLGVHLVGAAFVFVLGWTHMLLIMRVDAERLRLLGDAATRVDRLGLLWRVRCERPAKRSPAHSLGLIATQVQAIGPVGCKKDPAAAAAQ